MRDIVTLSRYGSILPGTLNFQLHLLQRRVLCLKPRVFKTEAMVLCCQ